MRPRILLADDYTLVLEALVAILRPAFEVVGAVRDGPSLLAAARQLQPDVVLLELALPGGDGLDLVRELRASQPALRCVFVTGQSDLRAVRAALAAGACGYVLKDATPDELVAAVWSAARHEMFVSPRLALDLDGAAQPGPAMREGSGDLTPRQREVLACVARGLTGKEIAATLGISLKTVEFHKACISRQLGLRTTAALTRYAVAHGLLPDHPGQRGA